MKVDIFNYSHSEGRQSYILLALIWSVLVIGSTVWGVYSENQSTLRTATAQAISNINKDIGFRKWVNFHGGIYVTPTEQTPPNPYLKVPDRDIVTTTGKVLTLMNPAYALREIQNNFPDDYGNKSHITSLKLLNPKNAPDVWEEKALHSFEQGAKEWVEIQQMDGQPYLRMMRPFYVDQGCLKCHERQGYKLGDVRGGISSSIYLKSTLAMQSELNTKMALSHGVIWLFGMTGLGISYRRTRRYADEHKRLVLELNRQAHTDYLTGVNNRRYFMALSEQELNRAIRYNNPLSMLMMDIDFFKQVNDTHGHKAGDHVLKKLADVCRETMREVDIVGRIGGEEFAILLPETGKEKSIEAAERLRVALEKAKVPQEVGGMPIQFTVSIGVASLVSKDDNLDVLLSLADKALYAAKETGRNKVCVAPQ